MFSVDEATAAVIRQVYEESGEFAAAVELRRRFLGIADNESARRCVRAIADHPIAIARARGLSFSINTDDPGPFACSLTSEMELVASTFGFDASDFESIFDNTMRAAFRGR